MAGEVGVLPSFSHPLMLLRGPTGAVGTFALAGWQPSLPLASSALERKPLRS